MPEIDGRILLEYVGAIVLIFYGVTDAIRQLGKVDRAWRRFRAHHKHVQAPEVGPTYCHTCDRVHFAQMPCEMAEEYDRLARLSESESVTLFRRRPTP